MIKRLIAPLSNSGEHQNWQFVKRRSHISPYNQQIQTSNKFLLLEETIDDMSETENGDQKEICRNNIPTIQKEKHHRRRPEVPITKNYIKSGSGYIRNENKDVPGNQTYAEAARNI